MKRQVCHYCRKPIGNQAEKVSVVYDHTECDHDAGKKNCVTRRFHNDCPYPPEVMKVLKATNSWRLK